MRRNMVYEAIDRLEDNDRVIVDVIGKDGKCVIMAETTDNIMEEAIGVITVSVEDYEMLAFNCIEDGVPSWIEKMVTLFDF